MQSTFTTLSTRPLSTRSSGSQILLQGLPSVPRPASVYTEPSVDASIHGEPSSSRATFLQPAFSCPLLWESRNRKRPTSSAYKKGGNKHKRIPTWTHTFVCLANRDQKTVPSGVAWAVIVGGPIAISTATDIGPISNRCLQM